MNDHLAKNSIYIKTVFTILCIVLIVQLFRIQILEHTKWQTRAELRNQFSQILEGNRGEIYFSDGSPLAINELAYGVFALTDNFDAKNVREKNITKNEFATFVADLFKQDEKLILDRIENPKIKYAALASKVSFHDLDILKDKFPEELRLWTTEQQIKRVYPNKQIAAKLVGFLGKNEAGEDIGRYGLEEYFDGVLKGTEGIVEGTRDSENKIIAGEDFESIRSKNGMDITLTIDKSIQAMLEDRLMYWFDKFKPKEITAVIMEPNTGRIMASANYPTYDPNTYWEGESINCQLEYYSVLQPDCQKEIAATPSAATPTNEGEGVFYPEGYEEKLKQLEIEKKKLLEEIALQSKSSTLDPAVLTEEEKAKLEKYPELVKQIFRKSKIPAAEVYRNAANSFTYEPGSVLKVITLAIAYNYAAIPRDPSYSLGSHSGCEQVADVKLCTAKKLPEKNLTVQEMLRKSDNVGALRVGQKVNKNDFVKTMRDFGLGHETGVELADESVFPAKEAASWSIVDQSTASYGQGSVSFTPIQLTNAWNILASGGKSYKPTLVKEVNDNGTIHQVDPVFLADVVSRDAALDALKVNAQANSESFKSAKDFYNKYPYSGKTGTANIPKTDGTGYYEDVVNTSFVGVSPVENPKFTMLVWFREPRVSPDRDGPNGANTAQAAWMDIAERLMLKLGVAPKQ